METVKIRGKRMGEKQTASCKTELSSGAVIANGTKYPTLKIGDASMKTGSHCR